MFQFLPFLAKLGTAAATAAATQIGQNAFRPQQQQGMGPMMGAGGGFVQQSLLDLLKGQKRDTAPQAKTREFPPIGGNIWDNIPKPTTGLLNGIMQTPQKNDVASMMQRWYGG